jgi:hypothetical protein
MHFLERREKVKRKWRKKRRKEGKGAWHSFGHIEESENKH